VFALSSRRVHFIQDSHHPFACITMFKKFKFARPLVNLDFARECFGYYFTLDNEFLIPFPKTFGRGVSSVKVNVTLDFVFLVFSLSFVW
jgi:hypothetical protein